jgi:hypothetical protein
MRLLFLALALAGATATLAQAPLLAAGHVHDVSCEVCRIKDKNGDSCKGKVTRGLTDREGIRYTCSAGHTFIVPPKVRVN